jgi:hypothetical protein
VRHSFRHFKSVHCLAFRIVLIFSLFSCPLTKGCGKPKSSVEMEQKVEQPPEERDQGGRIGDPLTHHRCGMFMEGQFSDFKLIWNTQEIPVHKCILFSESGYFRDLISGEWKDSQQGVIDIPDREIDNKTIEVFLHFIYTNLITSADLKQFLHELHYLSVYFQVKKLRRFCEDNFQSHLNLDAVERFLSCRFSDPKWQEILSTFIAVQYTQLSSRKFPFHKAGRAVVTQFVQKVAAKTGNYNPPYPHSAMILGPGIGKPSKHPQYEMCEKGTHSDFKIRWDGQEYSLHKCILYAESLYFRTFLASNWKESDSGEVSFPGTGITRDGFNNFLSFLYTGFISEDDLKENLFELYYLSDYFQAISLKELVTNAFKKYLNDSNAESFMEKILDCNASELKGVMACYLCYRFKPLFDRQFPFHKLGKIMLSKFLERLTATNGHYGNNTSWYTPQTIAVTNEEDEEIEDF